MLVALYTVAVLRRPLVAAWPRPRTCWPSPWARCRLAPLTDDQFYIDLVSVVATVMVGYGVALGRARASMAEQRAAELAREQETGTQAAVAQEQARIAREVHDIVAHDVSVMVAQAGRGPTRLRRPAADRRGRAGLDRGRRAGTHWTACAGW